jgi:hypothetical protein
MPPPYPIYREFLCPSKPQPSFVPVPPSISVATEHRAIVVASRACDPVWVRSPSLPLSSCTFLSLSSALQAGNRELHLAGHGAAVASHRSTVPVPLSLSLFISARAIFSRPIQIQRPRSKDTLSMSILQISPYN